MYKEGDYIKVVDYIYNNIPESIKSYLGTCVTVDKIVNNCSYRIKEDNGKWIWDDSLFERIATRDEVRKIIIKNIQSLNQELKILSEEEFYE